MTQKIALYTVSNGLAGCYMPDYVSGPINFTTRKKLAAYIRSELERMEFPASLFGEVNIRKLWSFIQRNGSSVAHFSLQHKGQEIAFHGMTQAEFDAAEKENE
jgi:hypothetical protein